MADRPHVVCPHCGAVNRVPRDRPAAAAQCGACHRKLFEGHPVAVDPPAYEKHVRGNDIPVLVDVWAPWCGPCRMMAPQFERAAAALEPDIRLLKLNADEAPDISARLGVRGIPALFLLQGGQVLGQAAGAMDARAIVEFARRHLPAA
ncbi:MAG: thiol reductase thioredoxin [Rhodospirillales bacterium]|jgi:thioredoxin 2|nr:thiol reductase thioredoxin [Rhodospirillales bacterium]